MTAEQFIGERIRTFREARGLKQVELAKLVGTSRPNVARTESGHGEHSPKLNTLARYAAALGTTVSVLTEGLEACTAHREVPYAV